MDKKFFCRKNKKMKERAFTLVEMMVSISIVTVIMMIILFDYSSFNDRLSLTSAQQEISIAIRQAQVYGLSVKESGVIGEGNFTAGYGIYVSPSAPNEYYIYSDIDDDNVYDTPGSCPAGGECVERLYLRNGTKINRIGGKPAGGGMDYNLGTSMSIRFKRPNPDARICFYNAGSVVGPYESGKIELISSKGNTASLIINSSGQVSSEF